MGQDASIQDEMGDRLAKIRSRVAVSCLRSGRAVEAVTIVAVTKSLPQDRVRKACALGLLEIGENRVQEVIEKFGDESILELYPETRLHLIGHLQSNKVRKAAAYCASIDSVDSLELAASLSRVSGEFGKSLRILIEVNSSGETQKHGIHPDKTLKLVHSVMKLPHLVVAGLMTVGPLTDDENAIRKSFRMMRLLFETVGAELEPPHWSTLSMGMSGDYEIAIEEGATEIRLGTALFGERN